MIRCGISVAVLCSAVFMTAFRPDDVNSAAAKLAASIQKVDSEGAREAIQQLRSADNRAAVDKLVKALQLCTKANEMLSAESKKIFEKMRVLQPKPNERVKGKGSREQMDKLHKQYYKISADFTRLTDIRRTIAEAVAAMNPELVVKGLARTLKAKGDPNDRALVAEVLGRVKQPEARTALVTCLVREKEPMVKVAVIDALAASKTDRPEVIKEVSKHLSDSFWQVAISAARMLEATGSPDAIPLLIKGIKEAEARTKDEINKALITLTKVNKHGSYDAWMDWWKRNEAGVRAKTYKPPKGEAAAKGEVGRTTFYGLPVISNKIVFVVDYSNSMHSPAKWIPPPGDIKTAGDERFDPTKNLKLPDNPAKIDVARYELKRALAQLKDGVKFNIVFFNNTVWPFSPRRMETLDRLTRERAFEFIDETGLILGTDVYEAMKAAFTYAGVMGTGMTMAESDVDTIILVSDGLPWLREEVRNDGVMDPDAILKAVREWNKRHKIVIHTVGIHADKNKVAGKPDPGADPDKKKGPNKQGKGGRGAKFLRQLAEENGGTYVSR